MGQSIQEWIKWNLLKTAFKNFKVIWSAAVVFSIWCVRSHSYTPAHAPLVWSVHAPFLFMTLIVWDIGTKKTKGLKLNSWSFSLTFANLSLVWMLYFHVWLQNKRKVLVWSECYNQFGIYQSSRASLLEYGKAT